MNFSAFIMETLTGLVIVLNPLMVLSCFAGITGKLSSEERKKTALKACAVAFCFLAVVTLGGPDFFKAIGISLISLKITGGILLFLVALGMLFDKKEKEEKVCAEKDVETIKEDLSVFPIAFPIIAGPGSFIIITAMLADAPQTFSYRIYMLVILAIVMGLVTLTLFFAETILRYFTPSIKNITQCIIGFLLGLVGIQIIIDGVIAIPKMMEEKAIAQKISAQSSKKQ